MSENLSLYQLWIHQSEDQSDVGQYQVFFNTYYQLETEAYRQILEALPEQPFVRGTFADLCHRLGFGDEKVIFMGFLDGVNDSLREKNDLEQMTEESEISLDIDFEKLLYNMHKAKAKWLFGLEAWKNALPEEKRLEIARRYRDDSTLRVEKIGRNDPCPCGSGKKYKKCCGRTA